MDRTLNWLQTNTFHARPIVVVEDHVYHICELLQTLQRLFPQLLTEMTVVCLDRAGPDTDAAVRDWQTAYPDLQVAARLTSEYSSENYPHRLLALPSKVLKNQHEYCCLIASLVRPRGLLLQDIELETLEFLPPERWWESTLLASTVRGIFEDRGPRCAFVSNKRGYEATFGSDLLAAGHDPRDVLNKYELEEVVAPFMDRHLKSSFTHTLKWTIGASHPSPLPHESRIVSEPAEREFIERQLDIVLWAESDKTVELGGRALAGDRPASVSLSVASNELQTWQELLAAHLSGEPGVETQSIGQRVAPAGALRAEVSNAAARHLHSLRRRLANPKQIVTSSGRYTLRNDLAVGLVRALNSSW